MANSHSRIRELGKRLAEILVLRIRRGRSVLLGVVHVGTALEVSYAGCALETQSGIRQVNILICTNRDECAGKALSIVRHQP